MVLCPSPSFIDDELAIGDKPLEVEEGLAVRREELLSGW